MENKTLGTALTVGAFAISIIGLILCILIMVGNEGMVSTAINLTLGLLVVAGGAALIFGLFHFLGNIKKNMPTLIAVIVFAVLAFVCYSLSSGEVLNSYDDDITPTASRLSETGLLIMYILIIAAVIAAVVGEVSRFFK